MTEELRLLGLEFQNLTPIRRGSQPSTTMMTTVDTFLKGRSDIQYRVILAESSLISAIMSQEVETATVHLYAYSLSYAAHYRTENLDYLYPIGTIFKVDIHDLITRPLSTH